MPVNRPSTRHEKCAGFLKIPMSAGKLLAAMTTLCKYGGLINDNHNNGWRNNGGTNTARDRPAILIGRINVNDAVPAYHVCVICVINWVGTVANNRSYSAKAFVWQPYVKVPPYFSGSVCAT